MRKRELKWLTAVLSGILAVLLLISVLRGPVPEPDNTLNNTTAPGTTQAPSASTVPSSTAPTQTVPPSTEPSTVPPTTVPPTTLPPTTVPPTTRPPIPPTTGDPNELIGYLYTRRELEALENEYRGYGPGKTTDGSRPSLPVSLNKQYQQYDTYFIGPDDNRVYLTFACAYDEWLEDGTSLTGLVLDVLKEKNVKATFFICRLFCINSPELVQRMIDEGHLIANHGSRHRCMPKQTIDGMVKDIMELDAYMKEHFGYTMTYYRPASGEFTTRVLAVAQSLGYTSFVFSFSYRDFDRENPPTNEHALKTLKECLHNGAIYQMHTIIPTTSNVLGEFIDYLRAEGYEPALVSEAYPN